MSLAEQLSMMPSKSAATLWALLLSTALILEFDVDGHRGWEVPTGNESQTYSDWVGRNRFHIGGTLDFKYENDSVPVVDRQYYSRCNTSNPLLEFTDRSSTFRFDRYGFFYFINGDVGHCMSGQRLVVRVMVLQEVVAVSPEPSASPVPWHSSGRVKLHGGLSAVVGGVLGFLIVLMLV